jgi:histone-lysine N-methyltransferase SETMAR
MCKNLGSIKKGIQRKRGDMWDEGIFLLHDNAPSHPSRVASSAVDELGYVKLTHPPYSPDLVPSDYFLFSKLKNFLRKRPYNNDN